MISPPRLAFHTWPAAVYAIGDVHGCLDQFDRLQQAIIEDGSAILGEKWIVTLGDHIDRGPASAGVIARLLEPLEPGFKRFSLRGNHEQAMLDFLADPLEHSYWLDEGGLQTLISYGVGRDMRPSGYDEMALRKAASEQIPAAHRQFLDSLPMYLSLPGWLFVHAGIRPGVPLAAQSDEDLLWIRAPFLTSQLTGGLRVVHGHTPGRDIVVTPHRIDVDTHCFSTGRLSAVRVTPDGRTRFFTVESAAKP